MNLIYLIMAMASGEVEIASETLRVESKVYYADLRANGRGAYVRLSERAGRAAAQPPPPAEEQEDEGTEEGGTAGTAAGAANPSAAAFRNSVCLPGIALQWFAAVLDYFVSCTPSSNRELPVENKICAWHGAAKERVGGGGGARSPRTRAYPFIRYFPARANHAPLALSNIPIVLPGVHSLL